MLEINGVRFVLEHFKRTEQRPSLFILLHGGGGVEAECNDKQHEIMQLRYVQSFVESAVDAVVVYPRGAGNTWDMHFRPESLGFYAAVIAYARREYDVECAYLLGYSAGADACWNVAECMSDCFDGICACCGHPNGVSASNLVNFVQQAGEDDYEYGRNNAAEQYARQGVRSHIHKARGHQICDNGNTLQELLNGEPAECNSIRLLLKMRKQHHQKCLSYSFAGNHHFERKCSAHDMIWVFQFGVLAKSSEFTLEYTETLEKCSFAFSCGEENIEAIIVIELQAEITSRSFVVSFGSDTCKTEHRMQMTREVDEELQTESADARSDVRFYGYGVYSIM